MQIAPTCERIQKLSQSFSKVGSGPFTPLPTKDANYFEMMGLSCLVMSDACGKSYLID